LKKFYSFPYREKGPCKLQRSKGKRKRKAICGEFFLKIKGQNASLTFFLLYPIRNQHCRYDSLGFDKGNASLLGP
jgi:hypothetical protein